MADERHALVVATSKYIDKRLPPLNAPSQDAAALRRVLGNGEIGAFTVKVSLNARIQALRKTLEGFFAHRDRDDLLLVHFSCHGLKDDAGQLYLAAADTEVDLLKATALDADWLRQLMNDCRSQRIAIFLDCCFGGAFAAGMIHKVGVDTPGINEHLQGSGRVVITASNAVQYAFESGTRVGDPEPSVFTRALVDGLRSGEADRNQDGLVTINELFDFLADKVREASPGQTPTKWEFNADGDWVIARSERTPTVSLARLPADLQTLIASPDTIHRLAALVELRTLATSRDPAMTASARLAVLQLVADDSQRVSSGAKKLLTELGPARDADPEEAAADAVEAAVDVDTEVEGEAEAEVDAKAEAEAAAAADAKAKADLLAQQQAAAAAAEEEQRAKAEADAKAKAQAEADAKAKAVADLLALQQAEADRRRDEQAQEERAAHERADAARLARDQAEADRVARKEVERAEAARVARLEAERQARRRRTIGIGIGAVTVAVLAGVGFAALGCLGQCVPGGSPAPSGAGPSTPVRSASVPSTGPGGSTGLSSIPPVDTLHDTSILFTSILEGNADIWIATPDGSSKKALVSGALDQGDPFWAPDGKQFVYRGGAGLATAPRAGKPPASFTKRPQDTNPAWSPDGKSIAFASPGSSGLLQLYTLALSNRNGRPRAVAAGDDRDWDPSWSPGSDRIAFVRTRGDETLIWVVALDDIKNPKPLTNNDAVYDDPAWSPDGKWIAATRVDPDTQQKQLWLMTADGKGGRHATTSSVDEHDPTWSRDSKYLAFARGDATKRSIVVVDLAGNELAPFGQPNAVNGQPDWH